MSVSLCRKQLAVCGCACGCACVRAQVSAPPLCLHHCCAHRRTRIVPPNAAACAPLSILLVPRRPRCFRLCGRQLPLPLAHFGERPASTQPAHGRRRAAGGGGGRSGKGCTAAAVHSGATKCRARPGWAAAAAAAWAADGGEPVPAKAEGPLPCPATATAAVCSRWEREQPGRGHERQQPRAKCHAAAAASDDRRARE